jgi:outer membrane protein OmpA-like peptidoglycan-associated protein
MSNLRVAIREQGANVAYKSLGRLAAGGSKVITWTAQPGVHEYEIEVSARGEQGQTSLSTKAVVTVMRPIEIYLNKEEVDLTTRRVPFSINNQASRVELTIFDPAGAVIHRADIDLSPSRPGARLEVSWPELGGNIGRIELRVFDVSDSWAGVELLPFRVEIPHVDVVFETAKWDIRPSERPKLDSAYDLIMEAIREHGSELKARLYVLGHTDTVGSPEDNMVLSRNRAASIAHYFQKKGGITLPILACGFGETMPLVDTGDNVDEPRNRRAQYILAAAEPVAGPWTVVSPGKP